MWSLYNGGEISEGTLEKRIDECVDFFSANYKCRKPTFL